MTQHAHETSYSRLLAGLDHRTQTPRPLTCACSKARELGMNPKKLGKLDNHDQEPWKPPLPAFIQSLYQKRFGKDRPDVVHSIEERARLLEQKNVARQERKRLRRESEP